MPANGIRTLVLDLGLLDLVAPGAEDQRCHDVRRLAVEAGQGVRVNVSVNPTDACPSRWLTILGLMPALSTAVA